MVLVHGDTTTAFAGAVAAFLRNIPIGHIEAGLRTSRFEYPFPEEGYRRAISRIVTLHFSPTLQSVKNLATEGITKNVYITGNTIVDSLQHISNSTVSTHPVIKEKYVLVTAHRRETYGEPLIKLCQTLAKLAHNGIKIVWPVHSNPTIDVIVKSYLSDEINVKLLKPVNYRTFISLLKNAEIVVTDSGGVMEECGVLNKPTLVLRTETERPEILFVDNIQLIGYDFDTLINIINQWVKKPPVSNPKFNELFGNGTAGIQIAEIISKYFK